MFDPQELPGALVDGVDSNKSDNLAPENVETPAAMQAPMNEGENETAKEVKEADGMEARDRRAEAGRKGAYRVHQLIREGKLYEQEHGLKRGRQRLRQLIELGKLYEQEHSVRPIRKNAGRERLSRTDREDILATFLRCLVRLAKPSFRGKLRELSKRLADVPTDHAA